METLDIFHQIKSEMLNQKYYFQSLIEQACYCGLLSDKELSAVQTDLLLILAEQTDKWCRGESSSIPTEKAQDIMSSILFVIGIQLKYSLQGTTQGNGLTGGVPPVRFSM